MARSEVVKRMWEIIKERNLMVNSYSFLIVTHINILILYSNKIMVQFVVNATDKIFTKLTVCKFT